MSVCTARLTPDRLARFHVRPRQLIDRTARPWARRRGLICKILTTGDCRPRYETAIVLGSCRHASSQWTARDSSPPDVLRPSSEDRLDSWKEIAAHLRRSVRTSRRWEAEEDLLELRRQMQTRDSPIALDLEVPWTSPRSAFLRTASRTGVTLLRGSPCILAWIDREREGNG